MPLYTGLHEWPKGLVAERVVSLVPSITELLYDLGLGERVVGITKFCIHPPEWFRTKQRVGGTKNVKTGLVLSLQPDLIIANREENVEGQVMELAESVNVFLTDIKTLDDALKMLRDIGVITGKLVEAEHLAERIQMAFDSVPVINHSLGTLYLIWRNPFMAAGSDTFINNLLERIGLTNAVAPRLRYPEIKPDAFVGNPPQLVLLSSEPYPFSQKHIGELQAFFPKARIELVDGELFSWYGSRLLHAPAYFSQCINRWNQTP